MTSPIETNNVVEREPDDEDRAWAWLDDYSHQRHAEAPADCAFSADQMVDAYMAGRQSLSDRIDVLEGALERVVSGGLPEQLLADADELEGCGAGNEAKRMRELVGRLKEFRRASLTQGGKTNG